MAPAAYDHLEVMTFDKNTADVAPSHANLLGPPKPHRLAHKIDIYTELRLQQPNMID